MENELNVELRPHRSRRVVKGSDGREIARVPHLIDKEIWVNDSHVGYCKPEAGAPICLIIFDAPKYFAEEIHRQVSAIIGGPMGRISMPRRAPDDEAQGESESLIVLP